MFSMFNTSPLPPVLEAINLRWRWDGTELLHLKTLHIPPGVTWVGGGDGRGKTTLLRLLAGDLAAPDATLVLSGLHAPGTVAYRQCVFWIDPRTEAFDQISAGQFFTHTAMNHPAWDAELLSNLVEAFGLLPHQDKPLYMLSTGSKRKVFLAAAFASNARLTLLDEPCAALDKTSIGFILDWLQDASSHHDRAWVMADYVAPDDLPLALVIDLGD